MALLRCDSFNHYDTLIQKWDFAFFGVIVNGVARTGTRSCQIIGGSAGPAWNLGPQQIGTNYNKLIQGVALTFDGLSANSDVMYFNVVAPAIDSPNIKAVVNLDGSISIFRGAGDGAQALLGTSVAGLFEFTPDTTRWNYLQVKWFGHATNGSVVVQFAPPDGPMSEILNISGVKTVAFAAAPVCNQVQILAAAGLAHNCYLADYYCTDWSDGSDFLGGVKIYPDLPFANGSPLAFTPSQGTNFQNVDSVPPDTTKFNSSGVVGAIDQYEHNSAGIPPNSSIKAVQHIMDMQTTTGPNAVTSVVAGIAHPNSVYLTNGFAMYTWQYDLNKGNPWKGADFPLSFGPEVTV